VWSFYTRVVEKKNPKTNPKNDLSNHEIKTPLLSHENTSIQNDSADEKPDSVIYACAPGSTSQSSIQTKSVMEEHSLSESMQQQSLTGNTSIQSFSDTEESVYNDLSSESMQHQSLTRSNSIQMHTAVESDSAIAPAHVLVSPLLNRCDLEFIPGVHPIEGGMGTVRQAMHHGVLVAVKSPKILSPMGPRSKSSFMKEINIIKCAHHYACVVLRGVVIDDESVMLVTEWMEGGSLNDALEHHEERPLSPNVRVKIARIIADGLQYLHSIKIIHRDIKSHNILLTRDYNAKLCDFGQAKLQKMTDSKSLSAHAGTFSWQAPEVVCGGKKHSEASDVYSFGIVMWELMTCDEPFPNCSVPEIYGMLNRHQRPDIPTPLPKGFSDEYVELMKRCWHQVTDFDF
jgi:hypothetical protein